MAGTTLIRGLLLGSGRGIGDLELAVEVRGGAGEGEGGGVEPTKNLRTFIYARKKMKPGFLRSTEPYKAL